MLKGAWTIGIAFHSPAKLAICLIGRKENSRKISSCLRSMAKHENKVKKVYIVIAQLTIDISII